MTLSTFQEGMLRTGGNAGYSIEFDIARAVTTKSLTELLELARELGGRDTVVGIGAPLAEALGAPIPGLRPLVPHAGTATLTAAQRALWVFLRSDTPGDAFDRASRLLRAAAPRFVPAEQTALFTYRDGRDLTGYIDGTANPEGERAIDAAVVKDGPLRGASFAFVQRFVHDLTRFERLPTTEGDAVIGRALEDNRELPDAPPSAHVKRTEQEAFEPQAFIVRRSMPWGKPVGEPGGRLRAGLQFIAFTRDLDRIEALLRRMVGAEDGVADALLTYTRAESGGYYFCPPVTDGRLDLSAFAAGA
jgi:porphyrinogen peroxidase